MGSMLDSKTRLEKGCADSDSQISGTVSQTSLLLLAAVRGDHRQGSRINLAGRALGVRHQ